MQKMVSTGSQWTNRLNLRAVSVPVQIMFVDRSDTVRARVAAGLLERVAEWNGYGRALYPYACGVEAAEVWCCHALQMLSHLDISPHFLNSRVSGTSPLMCLVVQMKARL